MELLKRVLIALISVPLIIYAILSEKVIYLFLFTILLSFFASIELRELLKNRDIKIPEIAILFNLLIIFSFYFSLKKFSYIPYFLFIFFNFLFFALEVTRSNFEKAMNEVFGFLLLSFYCGFLIGHLILFKSIKNGNYFLLYITTLCWFNDTFAYFTGSLFGRKKLPFKVSPNKSYAGVIGGIIFSILLIVKFLNKLFEKGVNFSLLFLKFNFAGRVFPLEINIILGIIFGFIIIFSDLIESLFKRYTFVKDSSSIIPGHGGFLDTFDSLIFSAPIFYYFCLFYNEIKL